MRLPRRRRRFRERPLTLVIDVSGSMAPYAEALLRSRIGDLSARPVRLIPRDPGSGRGLTWTPQLAARVVSFRTAPGRTYPLSSCDR